ncbi:MAG: UxaA family hydrolase, partial [Burkholderiaceae bacterium]
MSDLFLKLHPADDVLIARAQLISGHQAGDIKVRGMVPAGHKVAVRDIAQGAPVLRYNQIIGFASKPIQAGEHIH